MEIYPSQGAKGYMRTELRESTVPGVSLLLVDTIQKGKNDLQKEKKMTSWRQKRKTEWPTKDLFMPTYTHAVFFIWQQVRSSTAMHSKTVMEPTRARHQNTTISAGNRFPYYGLVHYSQFPQYNSTKSPINYGISTYFPHLQYFGRILDVFSSLIGCWMYFDGFLKYGTPQSSISRWIFTKSIQLFGGTPTETPMLMVFWLAKTWVFPWFSPPLGCLHRSYHTWCWRLQTAARRPAAGCHRRKPGSDDMTWPYAAWS